MSNRYRGRSEHSAEYLGDFRDHYWNTDYLSFLAERHWRLNEARSLLDVGAGVGHWGRLLASLAPALSVVGVDREPRWVDEARRRADEAGLGRRMRYEVGSAEHLPFDAACFDVVTCQTLLMHVGDPAGVLLEMTRVLRPGGLLVVAEPTNVASSLLDAIGSGDSPAQTARLLEFFLTCVRGKALLGEGDALIGERLVPLLRGAGLVAVEARLNDRAHVFSPPYDSEAARLLLAEFSDQVARGHGPWDADTTRRYFLAADPDETRFQAGWQASHQHEQRVLAGLDAGTYESSGGALFYVAWGRKPA